MGTTPKFADLCRREIAKGRYFSDDAFCADRRVINEVYLYAVSMEHAAYHAQ